MNQGFLPRTASSEARKWRKPSKTKKHILRSVILLLHILWDIWTVDMRLVNREALQSRTFLSEEMWKGVPRPYQKSLQVFLKCSMTSEVLWESYFDKLRWSTDSRWFGKYRLRVFPEIHFELQKLQYIP